MADKVKVGVKLELEHELGPDHLQTWLSQLKISFQLHGVTESKQKYLAAASNLGESASHYLWQRYADMPAGDDPFGDLQTLFAEYFGSQRSQTSRLAALFDIGQGEEESIQAFRHRVQKEMRVCSLTTSAKLDDVINTVAVHLFARGLRSPYTRQKILEQGDNNTLAKAAENAQAVALACKTVSEQVGSDEASASAAASVSFTAQRTESQGRTTESSHDATQSRSRRAATRGTDRDNQAAAHLCDYCGQKHPAGKRHCPAADATCSYCKKKGHLREVCKKRRRDDNTQASSGAACGWLEQSKPTSESYSVQVGGTGFRLPLRDVLLNDRHWLKLRVDSGSMVTLLPKSLVPSGVVLEPPPTAIQPVGASPFQPLGVFTGTLQYQDQRTTEVIYVVDDQAHATPALIGERASLALGLLNMPPVNHATEAPAADSLPAMKGAVHVHLQASATPVQQTARRVPPALLPSLRGQIDTWIKQGVVEPVEQVQPDDCVSPLVAVPKPDKTIRWCVDLRQVNKSIDRPGIQLPTADGLLAQLDTAKRFSKIDLKTGYSQLEVTPESQRCFVIASPLGYFRFLRLPFGVSSGPELFQRRMEQILAGCEGVLVYLDDILIFGASQEEHDARLDAVKDALKANQVTINEKKSVFNTTSVTFLGHVVSADGIAPGPDKVTSLQKMPNPTNLAELRAFLGLATYLSKFIPNLAATTKPLTHLLSSPWHWTDECSTAADTIRQHFSTAPVLSLFQPDLATRVEVDASGDGLGAVLTQQQKDGRWQPVYFASRKLTGPESRYAAIELEALAVSWAVSRFRNYLLGTTFRVITDHKPLLQVFAPDYPLARASLRVQRLLLRTQDLSFSVQYRPGKDNLLADALSRLPTGAADASFLMVHYVSLDDGLPTASRKKIAEQTAADATLCAVRDALRTNQWPSNAAVAPFQALRHELSVWPFPNSNDFVILRGDRLVIPEAAIPDVLEQAHHGHPGIHRTKARLREATWWPGWSRHVQHHLKQCEPCCRESQAAPVPLKPRELPPHPWHTIAVDLFFYQQRAFFSILDVYSRYPVVVPLRSESTKAILSACQQTFTLFGTPQRIISDNGPQFVSESFAEACQQWNCSHERIVPYTPRQNPVERLHQTLKRHMRQSGLLSADAALQVALQTLRSTINTVTGRTPGDLFLRGGYNTPLRALRHPAAAAEDSDGDSEDEVRIADARAKAAAKASFDDQHRVKPKLLNPGAAVFVKEPSGNTARGTVVNATPHDAVVRLEDGSEQRRHLDRILLQPPQPTATADPEIPDQEQTESDSAKADPATPAVPTEDPEPTTMPPLRRSSRQAKSRSRLIENKD